jgi:hypothetical protein
MISFLGRAKYPLVAAILFCLLIAAIFLWKRHPSEGGSYPKSFDGSSEDLKQTVIVPTLDTPFPDGKSAIWCSSFQIAWNKLKKELAKGPVEIEGAEEIAGRLNKGEEWEDDLEPEMFYADAGFVKDGVVPRIQSEMARRFPNVSTPQFAGLSTTRVVAYGYLQGEVKFTTPYLSNKKPFLFKAQDKDGTNVQSFGIEEDLQGEPRNQVEILYCDYPPGDIFTVNNFVLDLCKDSSPNQVVLAYLPRKETLAETLADLGKKTTQKPPDNELPRRLMTTDRLFVPNMNWRIEHHFKELEGQDKPLQNHPLRGLYIDPAIQMIEFKLDRSGARVSSESKIQVKGGPRLFQFDRPFLIYMKKRDAKHPFFVMWVDNAELLIKS